MKTSIATQLFTSMLLLLGNTACSQEMNQAERNKNTVKLAFEKWTTSESSFFDLLTNNVEWTVTGKSPYSGIYKGKNDFIQKAVIPITSKLKTNIKPALIAITAEDDVVWLNWKGTATTITDETYENHYAWMLIFKNDSIVKVTAFLDTYELSKLKDMSNNIIETIEESKAYIGMWVTEDGNIRHELLPNKRYDEARGNKKSSYQGDYKVTGNHIDYKDDTGFTADGEFKNGILYHAGMILYKEN
ncbi:Atu4866 domain-containing protein [Mesonia sp.]|uniref:Atu4866 domain-containing protein n=1 Tax=Mesonia sp. TaxID=1960830 RepID=UPI00257E7A7C|nr:Atu4866 domain-containing protein [Mesonia sp.]